MAVPFVIPNEHCFDLMAGLANALSTGIARLWRPLSDAERDVAKVIAAECELLVPLWVDIRTSSIPGAGLGVHTRVPIRVGTYLGYYKGQTRATPLDPNPELADEAAFHAYIFRSRKALFDRGLVYVDAMRCASSNFTRFFNCATSGQENNVRGGRILFYAARDIDPGEELCIYYGEQYAGKLGIKYVPRLHRAKRFLDKLDRLLG